MIEELIISVVRDFSDEPFGRDSNDDPYNGERFLVEVLEPAMRRAKRIVVNLDGVRTGYGSSWLDAAFVQPIREGKWTKQEFFERVSIIDNDEPYIAEQVRNWIREI